MSDTTSVFDRLILDEHLGLVFQPIVDLHGGERIVGYEALGRCADPAFPDILAVHRAATAAGRVGELGRYLRRLAVERCPQWPLFLNLFPNEFDQGFLVRPDDPLFRHRRQIYLEISEALPLSHFEHCHSVLAEIRERGVRLAIDDFGAGYSNLQYIADLEPDIVKLDRQLVAGLRFGSPRQRLLRSVVELCHTMGARVVAEGVETASELIACERAGVDMVQGFLLARPAYPPPELRSLDERTWEEISYPVPDLDA